MKNSGRGVYLIRRLMNKVEFNETGNVIRMTKHL
jgi:anti-sigma regulatory factor (Ser/Thr protein kinase)